MTLEFSCAPEVLPSTVQLCPRRQSHCLDASCMLNLAGGGWFEFYSDSHLDKADYVRVETGMESFYRLPGEIKTCGGQPLCDDCQLCLEPVSSTRGLRQPCHTSQ